MWGRRGSLPVTPVVFLCFASAMSVDYFEEDWVKDNWEDDDLIANAAGEIAEAAQQCISQPGGFRKAFHDTISSVKLFGFSAFIKTASIKEQSGAISEMKDVIAQTLVRISLIYTEYFRGG
jgi:hypothetical protein